LAFETDQTWQAKGGAIPDVVGGPFFRWSRYSGSLWSSSSVKDTTRLRFMTHGHEYFNLLSVALML